MDVVTQNYAEKGNRYATSVGRARRMRELMGQSIQNKKILDIGCGFGQFGTKLKEEGAYVVGTDISEQNISEAKKVLDEAYVCNVEEDSLTMLGQGFDIIVAGEVIEHLFSPELFLVNVKKLLSKNGFILITTPNFLVWTNRFRMLFGKFEYEKSGFFDEGHIHFFSYRGLEKTAQTAGLKVVDENHVIHPKIPQWFGNLNPSLCAYQFVIKLQPHE